jgi:hypothetical protein
VMRVFHSLNTHSYCTYFPNLLASTTETRSVDRTQLIWAELHRFLLLSGRKLCRRVRNRRSRNPWKVDRLVQSGPRKTCLT